MKSIGLGIAAAFFFAVTFVLNRSLSLTGASWMWSASLRYLFMIPLLMLIVAQKAGLGPLFTEMRSQKAKWLLWSVVGFGLFYAPLTFASEFGPGWLVAGTWQITIVSGTLLVPFFYETVMAANGPRRIRRRMPLTGLAFSLVILAGIAVMQIQHAQDLEVGNVLVGILPIVLASFAYPLGNRKMMELCGGRLDAFQRVLGMTLASLPFWLLLSVYALYTKGLPSGGQVGQSIIIAISSGVVATGLFFKATDRVKDDMAKLAAVEATQSVEVVFAVIGEVTLLGLSFPSLLSWIGLLLVIGGMVLHSLVGHGVRRSPRIRSKMEIEQH
ncbi:MAG: multidrug resistance efflux transporter family protein [Gorillibacterium sp.]|nr:multidrug resistance efflux transporter family protein [Gorillibacterium sp.]